MEVIIMDKAARVKTVKEYEFLKTQLLDSLDRPLLDWYALSFALLALPEEYTETFLEGVKTEVEGWNRLTRALNEI